MSALSDERRKEFDSRYKNQNLPKCPKCNSKENVVPALRGKPTADLAAYAREGNF